MAAPFLKLTGQYLNPLDISRVVINLSGSETELSIMMRGGLIVEVKGKEAIDLVTWLNLNSEPSVPAPLKTGSTATATASPGPTPAP